jgi:hypothetical protein
MLANEEESIYGHFRDANFQQMGRAKKSEVDICNIGISNSAMGTNEGSLLVLGIYSLIQVVTGDM